MSLTRASGSNDNGWWKHNWLYMVVMLLLLVAAAVLGYLSVMEQFVTIEFQEDAATNALRALVTLGVIAVLVERVLEVYVSGGRDPDRERIEEHINKSNDDASRKELDVERQQYRNGTRRITLLIGTIFGLLIVFVGPRMLAEVVTCTNQMTPCQASIFNAIDILISGVFIGGGSKGIHSVYTRTATLIGKK